MAARQNGKILLRSSLARFLSLCRRNDGYMAIVMVILGFLSATVLLMAAGRNPVNMYQSILQTVTGYNAARGVWNVRYIGEWLAVSMPLILCGLSVSFALKTGLFNIGAEGQYIVGVTFAQLFAFYLPKIPFFHAFACCILAAVAAGLWGGLAGWLKGKWKVSEVVSTIMLNYTAFFLSGWITAAAIEGTNTYRTPAFPETAKLANSLLRAATGGSTLNNGIFFVIVCIVLYHWVINKTRLGFELKATGFNSEAAKFAGISTIKNAFLSMAAAGFFAGLAGSIVALGSFNYGRVLSSQDQYGFTGIAVALVSGGSAVGNLLAGLLFGMLAASQGLMQSRAIPKEIAGIICGLVVVFISLRKGFNALFLKAEKALLSGRNP